MSEMLSQVFWLSLVLAGTGMVAGLILGFLLYPRLFRRPNGSHRRSGTTTSGDPAHGGRGRW
ncbi:hypothetical protein [Actinomadura sp. BRA 177]|uniref:hypothetical protein n=1 Tax=Actinomadura sp. BRA 177 TaxID=2745202 RepID=UPI0015950711|nr:hypothetical protein [Actinomadura sp. BRA 177]NVI92394.1 hypothetical protein [Actinomadura sp. BRA 177]